MYKKRFNTFLRYAGAFFYIQSSIIELFISEKLSSIQSVLILAYKSPQNTNQLPPISFSAHR